MIAVATAHLLGAEATPDHRRAARLQPVLTAIALGTVFYRPSVRVAAYAALGTVFTVVAQAALNVALTPLAIPALTAPFVLVAWLFLLPHALEPAQSGEGYGRLSGRHSSRGGSPSLAIWPERR